MNTHLEQRAAIYALAPGEQLGVRCLAQGNLIHGIEGEESAVHLLLLPTILAGPRLELTTFELRVRLSGMAMAMAVYRVLYLSNMGGGGGGGGGQCKQVFVTSTQLEAIIVRT